MAKPDIDVESIYQSLAGPTAGIDQFRANQEAFKKEQSEIQKPIGLFSQNQFSPKISTEDATRMAKKFVAEKGIYIPNASGARKEIKAVKDYADLIQKPFEDFANKNLEAHQKYNKGLQGITGESEMAAPSTNIGEKAVQDAIGPVTEQPTVPQMGQTSEKSPAQVAKESDAQSKAIPQQVKELMAQYPDLKREEIVDSYGFARKIAIGFLGGLAGRPDIFNELVDKKIKRYNEEFDYRLDKLMRGAEASAKATQQVFQSSLQQDTLLKRTLEGSIELAKAQYAKETAPLKKYEYMQKIGVLEQNLEPLKEQINQKQMAYDDLERGVSEALSNDSWAVKVMNPATGQMEQVRAKSEDIYKAWTQGDPIKGIPPLKLTYDVASQNLKAALKILNSGYGVQAANAFVLKNKFNQVVQALYPGKVEEIGVWFDGISTPEKIEMLQQIQQSMEDFTRNNFTEGRIPTTLLKDIQSRLKR